MVFQRKIDLTDAILFYRQTFSFKNNNLIAKYYYVGVITFLFLEKAALKLFDSKFSFLDRFTLLSIAVAISAI
jgi:hypothetical protein